MKRILLALSVSVMVISAVAQPDYATVNGPMKDYKVKQEMIHPARLSPASGGQVIGQRMYDNTIIGTTWYDSQTVNYGNVMQRMWAYPDGTVGATWQCSGQNSNPDRGTGYNYFDGSDWGSPVPHIGTDPRTGWPSYAPWGPNGEILSHYLYIANSGPIKFFKREIKGQGDWIETSLTNPDNVSLVWHSMCTSGENNEYIHLLALTYDTPYQGQTNALLYYRSSDGAETWEVDGLVIDGLGPDFLTTINPLSYAWANPVGETIAFTYGFDEFGGRVFKSTDNGDTWEYMQVFETPIDPFAPPTDSEDIPCGIGTSACALDSQGDVHVVFPRMVKIFIAGETRYYPFTDGLIYWNESMPVLDTTIISSYTLDYLYDAGNLCGWVMSSEPSYSIPDGQPSYANASCAFPQLSIDAQDNLFVVSSMLAPDYDNGTHFYRHIVLNRSFDLGETWEEQVDLNEDIQYIFSECAFPAMPPVIDENVHVLFQEDPFPGMFEWLANHEVTENRMMHLAIDKELLGVGLADPDPAEAPGLSLYPNPASDQVFVQLDLKNASDTRLEVVDQLGKVILQQDLGRLGAGNYRVSLDISSLPTGIYFIRSGTDQVRTIEKLVVR